MHISIIDQYEKKLVYGGTKEFPIPRKGEWVNIGGVSFVVVNVIYDFHSNNVKVIIHT